MPQPHSREAVVLQPVAPEKVQVFSAALLVRPDLCVEGERECFVLVI